MHSKYASNPPKYDYPYQKQQRLSGSSSPAPEKQAEKHLPTRTLREMSESAEKLAKIKS
jgi:hypothetical protein